MSYRLSGTLIAVGVLVLSGCAHVSPASSLSNLSSDDPRVRVSGVYGAQGTPGAETDARLVHLLVDEDVSVRMFASAALAKRTGQRFGYLAAAPLAERAASVRQWVQWCAERYPETSDRLEDLRQWLKNFETEPPVTEESEEARAESSACCGELGGAVADEPEAAEATP